MLSSYQNDPHVLVAAFAAAFAAAIAAASAAAVDEVVAVQEEAHLPLWRLSTLPPAAVAAAATAKAAEAELAEVHRTLVVQRHLVQRHVGPLEKDQAMRLVPKCSLHSDGNRGR